MAVLTIIFCLPVVALLVLAAWLLAEVVAGVTATPLAAGADRSGPIAVLVPAHDEAAVIGETLAALTPQLRPGDRVLVVADNCADDTAALARAAGAEVTERQDAELRGKGYALQHGLDALRDAPPVTVIVVDADCIVAPDALDRLAGEAERAGRPVQALYLMDPGAASGPKGQVSAFAWLLINRTRMTGLSRLAGTSRLLGTGMAFPWALAKEFELGTAEIVEDIALAAALTGRGHAPLFLPGALVTSQLPSDEAAATTQRARWEIGSLRLARSTALPLLGRGLARRDGRSVGLALDLLVPPLVVFGLVLGAATAAGLVLAPFGPVLPLILALLADLAFAAAVLLAWWRHGQAALPASSLGAIGGYARSKARVYGAEGRSSARTWTRTGRD